MAHEPKQELDSAIELLNSTIEKLNLPPWESLNEEQLKEVVKQLNCQLTERYADEDRHYMFGITYDANNALQLVAYKINRTVTEDAFPGSEHVDIL